MEEILYYLVVELERLTCRIYQGFILFIFSLVVCTINVTDCDAYFARQEFNENHKYPAKEKVGPIINNVRAYYLYSHYGNSAGGEADESILKPFRKNYVYLDKIDINIPVKLILENNFNENLELGDKLYANLSLRNTSEEYMNMKKKSMALLTGLSVPIWDGTQKSNYPRDKERNYNSEVYSTQEKANIALSEHKQPEIKSLGLQDSSHVNLKESSFFKIDSDEKVNQDVNAAEYQNVHVGSDLESGINSKTKADISELRKRTKKKQISNKKNKTPWIVAVVMGTQELIFSNLRATAIFILAIGLLISMLRKK